MKFFLIYKIKQSIYDHIPPNEQNGTISIIMRISYLVLFSNVFKIRI